MKTETVNFAAANTRSQLFPRWLVEISLNDANTDLLYLTSHPDVLDRGYVMFAESASYSIEANDAQLTLDGAGGSSPYTLIANTGIFDIKHPRSILSVGGKTGAVNRIDSVIERISGQSQRITPDRAQSTIGNISIRIADVGGAVTAKLSANLSSGEGLRRKRIVLYKGHQELTSFDDYAKRLTYLIEDIKYKDGIYIFQCTDIQRTSKENIFEADQGVLTSSIDATTLTIPVTVAQADTKFPLVEHDTVYSANAPIERAVAPLDLTNAAWTKTNVTITANDVAGPLDVIDADKVESNGTHPGRVAQSYSVGTSIASTTWRYEVWLRTDAAEPKAAKIWIENAAGFDTSIVTVTLTTEWQKFILYHTFSAIAIDTSVSFGFDVDPSAVNTNYLYHGGSSFYAKTYVGYIKIDDEIIAHTGWSDFTFTALNAIQRGALNSIATAHTVTASESDQKKKIEEYIYLEMAAPKMIYAILTGTLVEQQSPLPDHWNLSIPAEFVTLSDFENIGRDLWDARTNKGRIARFIGVEKIDGKKFIEDELLLWLGAFMPIYSDGAFGLKRLQSVLPDSGAIARINEANILRYSDLHYDQKAVINNIAIRWNWIDSLDRFTKTTILVDSNSVSKYGRASLREYQFKGVFVGLHADDDIEDYFAQIRERYAAPPLRLTIDVMPEFDRLDVGDTVQVTSEQIKDFNFNTSLDRTFEIQQVRTDWITGIVTLDLFGGVERAARQSRSENFVMQDAFYTAKGTELSTVLTITSGAVTANGTLTGADNHEDAVYYYDGDLTINAGVTITTTKNVQLRIKGALTINGTINAKGGGMAGGAGANAGAQQNSGGWPAWGNRPGAGTPGIFGTTACQECVTFFDSANTNNRTQYSAYLYGGVNSHSAKVFARGQLEQLPALAITNPDGLQIDGLLPDLRGTGGCGGNTCISLDTDLGSSFVAVATGSAGGAGGGGLVIITRGTFFGSSGVIDTSGADGAAANSGVYSTRTLYAGGGTGGYPGAAILLIDGDASTPSTLNFTQQTGAIDFPAVNQVLNNSRRQILGSPPSQSYAWHEVILHESNSPKGGLLSISYIPPSQTPFVWLPQDEQQEVSNPNTTVPSGGSAGQVLVVDETGTVTWGQADGWSKLSETNITSGASITPPSWDETAYSEIKIVIEDLQIDTDGEQVQLQLGSNNGATIYNTNEYNGIANSGTTTWTTIATAATHLRLTAGGAMGNATDEYFNSVIEISNFTNANIGATVKAMSFYHITTGADIRSTVLGETNDVKAAIDTCRILPSAGNLRASGTIKIYGFRK